jgi:hypothetical protein
VNPGETFMSRLGVLPAAAKILVDKPWIFSKIVYWSIKSPKTPEIDFKKKKKKYQLLQKIQRSRQTWQP